MKDAWWIQLGPYDYLEIERLAAKGGLRAGSLVRRGEREWTRADQFEFLRAAMGVESQGTELAVAPKPKQKETEPLPFWETIEGRLLIAIGRALSRLLGAMWRVRRVLVLNTAVLLVALSLLFPPWARTYQHTGISQVATPIGYAFVLTPPDTGKHPDNDLYGVRIDVSQLSIQLIAIVALAAAAFVMTGILWHRPAWRSSHKLGERKAEFASHTDGR